MMYKIAFILFLFNVTFVPFSLAQDDAVLVDSETGQIDDLELPPVAMATDSDDIRAMGARIPYADPKVALGNIRSLFFTPSEIDLISDARNGLFARAPSDSEIQDDRRSVKRGPRELSVGGIIYTSKNDWTVWLNGQKITPKRLPSEILDIRVEKDSVRLRWFDEYTNQIFPVKLRTHQRFNIDTRIFLPG